MLEQHQPAKLKFVPFVTGPISVVIGSSSLDL